MVLKRYSLLFFVSFLLATEGLAPHLPVGEGPHGPRIVFDREPVADVPLPNDIALIDDATTRTGVSWAPRSYSPPTTSAQSQFERLDGFGPFGPIFMTFDRPLDLATVTNDTMILVNIEPNHPRRVSAFRSTSAKVIFLYMRPHEFFGHDHMKDFPRFCCQRAISPISMAMVKKSFGTLCR